MTLQVVLLKIGSCTHLINDTNRNKERAYLLKTMTSFTKGRQWCPTTRTSPTRMLGFGSKKNILNSLLDQEWILK